MTAQIKTVVGEYALLGIGFLLFIGIGGLLQGDPTGIGGAIVAAAAGAGFVAVGLGFGPYLAIRNSRGISNALTVEDNVLYAATFIANAAGYLALGILVLIGGAIGVSGELVGQLLLPIVGGSLIIGAIGVLTIFYEQLF
ncbi:hypothetical protein GJ629_06095 [Halapricum sp. CBA1109]|uniref:hypothetical protein n=1 Tax=Halapricum sp. CBA1109 TaxID=2668068 RepID=UPI0012FBFC8D|nr:hypothetical protein [Halapricum sp. CBA1109]MUV89519.1 hypothetical protein [Halapricum sp. CBA1109]